MLDLDRLHQRIVLPKFLARVAASRVVVRGARPSGWWTCVQFGEAMTRFSAGQQAHPAVRASIPARYFGRSAPERAGVRANISELHGADRKGTVPNSLLGSRMTKQGGGVGRSPARR